MKYLFGMAAAVAAFGMQTQAHAADDPRELEEITVTASPLGQTLQPALILDDEELLLKRTPSIGETLASEPGVSSSYFGPAASRPIIRGLGGGRVSVLTDRVSSLTYRT